MPITHPTPIPKQESTSTSSLSAEELARKSLPHSYRLITVGQSLNKHHGSRGLKIFTFGCHGNAKTIQKQLADFMAYIAKHPEHEPDIILLLGDNFYEHGINSAHDPMIQSHFQEIYQQLKKPCFVVWGNHDVNYQAPYVAKLQKEYGIERGLPQIAISYLAQGQYVTTAEKKSLYSQETLTLAELPLWNMPHRFYSLITDQAEIFCLDSNNFVRDYVEYKKDPEHTPHTNQVKWFKQQLEQAQLAKRKTIVAMHHPLFTPGKRAYKKDALFYFPEEDIQKEISDFFQVKLDICGYTTLLKRCFMIEKLYFDTLLCAHDHAMYYYNNKIGGLVPLNPQQNYEDYYPLSQITSGGGGGKLQSRFYFEDQGHLAYFIKQHGFTEISIDHHGEMELITRTIDKEYELRFDLNKLEPLRLNHHYLAPVQMNQINLFRKAVLAGVNAYCNFLKKQQLEHSGNFYSSNLSHGKKGLDIAHNTWSFINNYYISDYASTVEKIYFLTRWEQGIIHTFFTKPSDNSFITLLNTAIQAEFGEDVTLAKLYQERHTKTHHPRVG